MMTETGKAGRQPFWVEALTIIGIVWVAMILISGGAGLSDDFSEQLTRWGISAEKKRHFGRLAFLFPIAVATLPIVVGRIFDDTAARRFAWGVAWGGAIFLLDPALRILLHVAAPAFAMTDAASLLRTTLAILLVVAWFYAERKRGKKIAAALKEKAENPREQPS